MKDIYPFICRNYGNISYKELMNMGYEEFMMKLGSIPESEPLFTIYKSRSVNIGKIKDKLPLRYENAQGESIMSGWIISLDKSYNVVSTETINIE